MSKAGKVLFLFSFFALLVLFVSRLTYGGWHASLWVPFGLFVVLGALGVAKDWRALQEIALRRSTKYGMNTGLAVAIAVGGLICVNVLATRYEKKMDWTSERLNSLSEQSLKVARSISVDTELVLLTGKDAPTGENIVRSVGDLVDMYTNVNPKIRLKVHDALARPDLAQKFEYSYGPYAFFAVQGERKLKIDPPNEESVTRALMKFGRDKKKNIYFTRGHGEILLDSKDQRGLSTLKDNLSVTYEVKSLALFENKDKVPDDADVVAVVGPTQQFLEVELQALRDYVRRGGHLFLALDPGTKHNLAQLTKSFGVEFKNDFVLDLRSQALKGAPSLVLGTEFAPGHEITRAFKSAGNEIALFEMVSSLQKDPDVASSLAVDPLVRTDASTANFPELRDKLEFKPNGPHTVAMTVSGRQGGEGAKEFGLVVFGDSDFLANRLIHNNLNRDLSENAFAWLSADKDLISIRPKEPKGTKILIMDTSRVALSLALFGCSMVLFTLAAGVWWRRRMA